MTGVTSVLHLASFNGNIGDNINHSGFKPWFASLCETSVEWHSLEIRKFYRGEWTFARDFLQFAERSDVIVVGGGNYLELWPANSASGMSLDLPLDALEALGKPVFLNSLGVDGGQGVSDRGRQGLQDLIDWIGADNRRLLSVRNDGSFGLVEQICRPSSLADVHRTPDAGFFQTLTQRVASSDLAGASSIAVNLAMDMEGHRYPGGDSLDYTQFCRVFAGAMADVSMAHSEITWVFVPHIYSDLRIMSDVLAELPDNLRRSRVEVAPYGSGENASQAAMSVYAAASVILGMRFHSCIAGLSLGVPTIGLANYPQVPKMFAEVGAPQLAIDVRTEGGVARLRDLILAIKDDPDSASAIGAKVRYQVGAERRRFEPALMEWLGRVGMARAWDPAST